MGSNPVQYKRHLRQGPKKAPCARIEARVIANLAIVLAILAMSRVMEPEARAPGVTVVVPQDPLVPAPGPRPAPVTEPVRVVRATPAPVIPVTPGETAVKKIVPPVQLGLIYQVRIMLPTLLPSVRMPGHVIAQRASVPALLDLPARVVIA